MVVEVATAFAVVESKDTDIVTKADRPIPLFWLWWLTLRSSMKKGGTTEDRMRTLRLQQNQIVVVEMIVAVHGYAPNG